MLPDSTAVDSIRSDDVCTVTCGPPGVTRPIVNPLKVTENNIDDRTAAPAVVMTTDVPPVAPHVPVSPATLLLPAAAVGVMDGAKKPKGYVSVMVPPTGMAFNGVNPSVTGTPTLPAFRSDTAIENETSML